ncbi:sugar nucleotide-binding protein [Microbispora amethystogenes]|uniref:dTDP-4-dehydrorhamnose reductase n=1 Tax=Microbispora amethystogenes TaxID=1427754 RepID=A0ABQ4F8Y4_9ACTN|nr:sugar nucleotide-binding protein [Microbispora amethystogenes]GIH31276.1 dTDP-4-dehydrorhamnose reductase [Microbispora amethystogenes]
MRILIVGGSGLLGGEVVRQATTDGHVVAATYLTRPGTATGVEWLPLDIRDRSAVFGLIGAIEPDVVVNAAFRQPDWETTAVGAAHVAVAASGKGGRLVHVSSDAVFSGQAITYTEDSVPDPVTPYGAAKAAAEVAVQAIDPTALIVRTSLIIGDGGSVHESRVHALAAGDTEGVLFTDDVRCPVHVSDLAAALLELAKSDRAGVHHAAGADAMSRYELGRLIAQRDGLDPDRLPSGRRAGTDVPGPIDVRLDCRHTQRYLTTRLRGAREFLR